MKTLFAFVFSILLITVIGSSGSQPESHSPASEEINSPDHSGSGNQPESHSPHSEEIDSPDHSGSGDNQPETDHSGHDGEDDDRHYQDGKSYTFGTSSRETEDEWGKIRNRKDNITNEIERKHHNIKCKSSNFTTVLRDERITVTIPITWIGLITQEARILLCNTFISELVNSSSNDHRIWVCKLLYNNGTEVMKRIVVDNNGTTDGAISATGSTNSTSLEPAPNTTPTTAPTTATPTTAPVTNAPTTVPTSPPTAPVKNPTSPPSSGVKVAVSLLVLIVAILGLL
eukprot:TRINITY_DN239_c0_g1_i1.p1 TRINITY_DN239_c0_g1~~TRINITY_DN239_c0_g1_i1.p1  ORF type:complete len:286 (+),score=66.51 TRINITY_DN239_c0_g1_i1:70-927(+)